ncbi:MAG: glycoside hydrolase family 1 protein [Candidatus Paceibacterota bacterium]
MSKIKFPKNFLWGSATSAYQVEGGIDNCDWSEEFPAGKACDHYNKFREDFELLEALNQDIHRFSIEWSRIEPEPGEFDQKEIEHYRKVLKDLKSRDVKTMVSLHHITTPLWLDEQGNWTNTEVINYFPRFAQRVFGEYNDLVDYWITINEPIVYAFFGYLVGEWMPQKESLTSMLKVVRNQLVSHRRIYDAFHKKDSGVKVGITKNNSYAEPLPGCFLNRVSTSVKKYLWNEWFLNRVNPQLDFIGLNYYRHEKIKFPLQIESGDNETSDMGWEIYPEGIYHVLKDLKKYDKPIFITENGVADAEDQYRKEFIKNHLRWVHKAFEEGVDVRGYLYWSLMDNFEWADGYGPRFGLVEVDYDTLERKIRDSARYYAQIARNNSLTIEK